MVTAAIKVDIASASFPRKADTVDLPLEEMTRYGSSTDIPRTVALTDLP